MVAPGGEAVFIRGGVGLTRTVRLAPLRQTQNMVPTHSVFKL